MDMKITVVGAEPRASMDTVAMDMEQRAQDLLELADLLAMISTKDTCMVEPCTGNSSCKVTVQDSQVPKVATLQPWGSRYGK